MKQRERTHHAHNITATRAPTHAYCIQPSLSVGTVHDEADPFADPFQGACGLCCLCRNSNVALYRLQGNDLDRTPPIYSCSVRVTNHPHTFRSIVRKTSMSLLIRPSILPTTLAQSPQSQALARQQQTVLSQWRTAPTSCLYSTTSRSAYATTALRTPAEQTKFTDQNATAPTENHHH